MISEGRFITVALPSASLDSPSPPPLSLALLWLYLALSSTTPVLSCHVPSSPNLLLSPSIWILSSSIFPHLLPNPSPAPVPLLFSLLPSPSRPDDGLAVIHHGLADGADGPADRWLVTQGALSLLHKAGNAPDGRVLSRICRQDPLFPVSSPSTRLHHRPSTSNQQWPAITQDRSTFSPIQFAGNMISIITRISLNTVEHVITMIEWGIHHQS